MSPAVWNSHRFSMCCPLFTAHHVLFCRSPHPIEKAGWVNLNNLMLLHASIHFSKRTILKQDEDDTGVVQEKCSSGLLNLPVCRVGFPFTSCCRCRCAALPPTPEPDSLQRAPGQPAVSAKRDQNNLLRFVINIGAGEGGSPPRLQMRTVPAAAVRLADQLEGELITVFS